MLLSDPEIDRLIAAAPVARLATVTPAGQPHVVPVVFAEAGGDIYSPIDGKAKRAAGLARLRNVAAHPAVSLLIDHYASDWRALWWVRIDGTADVVTESDLPAATFSAAVGALRLKYPQYATFDLFYGTPTLLRIRPRRRSAWAAEPDRSNL